LRERKINKLDQNRLARKICLKIDKQNKWNMKKRKKERKKDRKKNGKEID
jgi:hypothetical protein